MKRVIFTRLWTFLNSPSTLLWLAALSLILLFHASGTVAREVTFAWNANPEPILGGYRLYSGPASRNYTSFIDIGNQTTYTVFGLKDDVAYYFAVTAYDTTKTIGSGFSNEVVVVPTSSLTVNKAGSGAGVVTGPGLNCGVDCAETYKQNTVITLTATPYAGSTFAGWSGCDSYPTPQQCRTTMNVSRTVIARFNTTVAGQTALTLYKAGNGLGTVTSAPTGLNCGATCTTGVANFATGTTVTLTATAATGSTFAGWGGACAGTGLCRVTLNAGRVVTATFTRPTFTVSKAGSGAGRVTSVPAGINCGPTCTAPYNRNTAVTLTAAAHAGSIFAGWSGACSGTAATCVVTLDTARIAIARFNTTTRGQTALTLYKVGAGLGTVTSAPAGVKCGATCTTGVANFATGATVTLTATPATGSTFAGWGGACAGTGACRVTLTAGKVVTASFTRPVLTVRKTGSGLVTSTPAGINCDPACAASYNLTNPPLTVTLRATPATGYRFGSWSNCVSQSSAPLQCTVPMNQSRTVTANFIR